MGYNGWKNYETWNVWLWIANDFQFYEDAVRFMRRYSGKTPYKAFVRSSLWGKTPDGVSWLDPELDYEALDEAMRELLD